MTVGTALGKRQDPVSAACYHLSMDRNQHPIAGILLAAGTSSRMGRNKLLLEIDGEPMIRRIVKRSLEARLDPVLVITGHQPELAAAALDGLSHQIVSNPLFVNGMTTSLQAGISALPAHVEAALMILGDMPYVTSKMMADLVEVFRSSASILVLSRYDTVNAPPTLFGRELFAELLELPLNRCPRSVAKRYRESTAVLDWPLERLKDLDRPDDLSDLAGLGKSYPSRPEGA